MGILQKLGFQANPAKVEIRMLPGSRHPERDVKRLHRLRLSIAKLSKLDTPEAKAKLEALKAEEVFLHQRTSWK